MNEVATDLDVWVLAGQSNMEGVGLLDGALAPDERVVSFSSAGAWEVAQEPLHRLWESFTPVHQTLMRGGAPADRTDEDMAREANETRVGGAGLGMAFGAAIADAAGKKVGLIPAAHGGTSLEQWNPSFKNKGGESLYGAMLERIKRAGGNLRGILWYQGESDCNDAEARTYLDRMEAWINAARDDTGNPELPVLVVQLGRLVVAPGSTPEAPWNEVRSALAALPRQVNHTAVAPAIDLGLVDCIHIDTPGLVRLGRRLARLALQLEKAPHELAGPEPVGLTAGAASNGLGTLHLRCRGVCGGWLPRHHMAGFTLHDSEGVLLAEPGLVDVSADSIDPTAIRILLGGPVPEGVRLGYGLGLNPYCNVTDEADMALEAFWPRALDA